MAKILLMMLVLILISGCKQEYPQDFACFNKSDIIRNGTYAIINNTLCLTTDVYYAGFGVTLSYTICEQKNRKIRR